jgi:hypothetical protein
MCSPVRLCCAISLALLWSSTAWSAPKAKSTARSGLSKSGAANKAGVKKSAKEISADDGLQRQMDWETKLLGPNTEKKIDLVKIQKLQAQETARREKQEKIDRFEKERKEREAALAAQRKDLKAPSSREVPVVESVPVPAKPVEKHDDAFVDKLIKDGKSGERKRPTVSNDDVDELLAKAKQDKGASITPKPTRGGRTDSVDQLLATADQQQAIKTTTKKPSDAEPVSAEAAAREASLKALALANARAQEERDRNKRLAIPDAAMLRAQQPQGSTTRVSSPSTQPRAGRAGLGAQPTATAQELRGEASDGREGSDGAGDSAAAKWKDPFANESASPARRSKISTAVVPASTRPGIAGRHAPTMRPAGTDRMPENVDSAGSSGNAGSADWKDPFDSAAPAGPKSRPVAPKAKPVKAPKRSPHWKDPFA